MAEVYKSVTLENFQDKYKVSNKGNVMNTDTNYILKPNLKMGYHYAHLTDSDNKSKSVRVHRLVALAFIPNDDKKKTSVNHKNGNKIDNNVDNLEWVTPTYNTNHAYKNKLIQPFERKVCKCDLEGNVIETYKSIKDASIQTGIDDGGIVKVCKGQRQIAGGFKWKYHETFANEDISDLKLDETKAIDGYPEYRITKEGKVYSVRRKKYLKTAINEDGYETIQLQVDSKKKDFLVHRLVALGFIDNPENKKSVNHLDGNKLNNNKSNLEWSTTSENNLHYHRIIKQKKTL